MGRRTANILRLSNKTAVISFLFCALLAHYTALARLPAAKVVATGVSAEDLMERSRAMYQSLGSYSDAGTIDREFGYTSSPSRERHSFSTLFQRAPRHFLFDFKKYGGDEYVIWGDPGAFYTWWKTTQVKTDYPNPNNAGAFSGTDVLTSSSAAKVPTLLYAKGALPSDFTNFSDAVVEGTDDIGGHRCSRLAGTARDVYSATGHEVNLRKMTVWIDAESLLIRKVVEEWKPLPNQVSRTTTSYEPQANPKVDENRFRFVPPK